MENLGNQKKEKAHLSEGPVKFSEADSLMKADAILGIIKLETSGVYEKTPYTSETGEERVLIKDTKGQTVFDDLRMIYDSYKELVEIDLESKLSENLDKDKWN